MGNWSKRAFGRKRLPTTAIVVAGTTPKKYQRIFLNHYDKVLAHEDAVSNNYIVRKGTRELVIVSNVYGAPHMIDILHALHDGGCKNVIFLGYAYSDYLAVGSVFVATKVFCLDGLTNLKNLRLKYAYPNKDLLQSLQDALTQAGLSYRTGSSVSISSIFHRVKGIKTAVQRKKINALEMELSSAYYFSKKLGMCCAGLLIVSDNKDKKLSDGRRIRSEMMCRAFVAIDKQLSLLLLSQ